MQEELKKTEHVCRDELNTSASYSGAKFRGMAGRMVLKEAAGIGEAGRMQIYFQDEYFRSPKVHEIAENSFVQDYIMDAVTADVWISRQTELERIDRFIFQLKRFIMQRSNSGMHVPGHVFYKKILNILRKLKDVKDIRLAEQVACCMPVDGIYLSYGYYHGDLTFSNILFDENDFPYLIDFTPGYIQSPVLDIVKLRQETGLYWTPLITGSPISLNYVYACTLLNQELEIFGGTKFPEMLNLLRILPYSKGPVMTKLLHKKIQSLL